MDFLTTLSEAGSITPEQLTAVETAVAAGDITEEQALLDAGVAALIVRDAYARYYSVPAEELQPNTKLSSEVLEYIPEESARHYRIVPLRIEDSVLVVGVNDPDNLQVREVLNFITARHNVTFKMVFMLAVDIGEALEQYANLTGEVDQALDTFESELDADISNKQKSEGQQQAELAEHLKEDAPVTRIVATILRYAVDGGASDIHIEPTQDKVVVRFRVDGILARSLELPAKVQAAIVARVKILAGLRLDEKRKPQDGRFSTNLDNHHIDFRVSTLPTSNGEKVVMRILDNEQGVTSLEDTGVMPRHLSIIRQVINEPYGIILISGPTGSGKSTTLYAMLSELDREGKNILSLEDPVEYNIEGVSQSQVRPEIGYTFASGLRSALRQDPDVIMVGEIRDKETAQLAIQAALTGHLVLSTIHTNNSIGVIPRLIDMGVDPYLIAPTLKIAIAQRLARRVCPGTGREESTAGSVEMMIENEFKTLPDKYHHIIPKSKTIIHPEPSPECASGTKGRIAVMEILQINDRIQDLILQSGSEEDIFMVAREQGFTTIKEDALIKALNHLIPYEEVAAFGTKVGLDASADEVELPVDNHEVTVETDV